MEAILGEFPDTVILDLSADYRFDTKWTYGLPERFPGSNPDMHKLIANPGCYATGCPTRFIATGRISCDQTPVMSSVFPDTAAPARHHHHAMTRKFCGTI